MCVCVRERGGRGWRGSGRERECVCVREREGGRDGGGSGGERERGGGMEGGERERMSVCERESIQNKNILSFKIEFVAEAGVINFCLWLFL